MELILEHLSKKYKGSDHPALHDFSAQFKEGIYGLLGPNGAGKSTLMNIIAQAMKSDTGSIRLNNQTITEKNLDYLSKIGFMPQQQNIYHDFTAERFMWYLASLKGLKKKQAEQRIGELLSVVNLQGCEKQKLGSFSGGMKQRILIAQSLLNDPQILILDEPTAGVDPQERVNLRNFIRRISSNKIVILSTHVVSDVENTADFIICLKKGKMIEQAPPSVMTNQYPQIVWTCVVPKEELTQLQNNYLISGITPYETDSLSVRVISEESPKGFKSCSCTPTLEELYLYLYKD